MRRADRLFQIIQILRREQLTTARQLAGELEVSERTIYRDVQDLIGSGVPVEGEAGVGYQLGGDFDLPPLMFDAQELEALILGASMVASWADPELSTAAGNALSKIGYVVPEDLRSMLAAPRVQALGFFVDQSVRFGMAELRRALRERRKCRVAYRDSEGKATERVLWPLGLYFWGRSWTLAAWCELRGDYRSFRLDRMERLAVGEEHFEETGQRSLRDFIRRQNAAED